MPEDLCTRRPLFGGAIASSFPLRFQDVSNIRQVPDHQEVFVDPNRDESLVFELLDLKTDVADQGSASWFLQDLANEQDAEGTVIHPVLSAWEAYGLMESERLRREQLMYSSRRRNEITRTRALCSLPLVLPPRDKSETLDHKTFMHERGVLEQSGVFEADGLRFRSSPAIITTAVGQMAISKGRQGRDAQNIVKVYLANLRLKDVSTDILVTAYEPVLINPLSESAATVGAGLAASAAESGCMPMAEVFRGAVSSFKVNDWSLFGAVA